MYHPPIVSRTVQVLQIHGHTAPIEPLVVASWSHCGFLLEVETTSTLGFSRAVVEHCARCGLQAYLRMSKTRFWRCDVATTRRCPLCDMLNAFPGNGTCTTQPFPCSKTCSTDTPRNNTISAILTPRPIKQGSDQSISVLLESFWFGHG